MACAIRAPRRACVLPINIVPNLAACFAASGRNSSPVGTCGLWLNAICRCCSSDTEMLFARDLVYQPEPERAGWALRNVHTIRAARRGRERTPRDVAPRDADACCASVKTVPSATCIARVFERLWDYGAQTLSVGQQRASSAVLWVEAPS